MMELAVSHPSQKTRRMGHPDLWNPRSQVRDLGHPARTPNDGVGGIPPFAENAKDGAPRFVESQVSSSRPGALIFKVEAGSSEKEKAMALLERVSTLLRANL